MIADSQIQKLIGEIIDRIVRDYQPEKIVLFGSFAYGRPHRDSDVDLLIIKDTAERPIDRRVTVRRLLAPATGKIPVELLVLTPRELGERQAIGDQFIGEILRCGKVLYAA
ncbi:MAG: nucleotidyltransferase domain-containing protein [Candidatus Hydrogenedentes bacterium]|nr:nucleotidyltransferase domain-containing protein [Candidatus Hydrogenedentota bacterium]